MGNPLESRTYRREECAVFRKTAEAFGGLSNMAPGFPVRINGSRILTVEALYQACRFPHRPEVQRKIIEQTSPMTAKMVGKPFRDDSRADWDRVRVKIMRWVLRVKLSMHWTKFSELLLSTGDRPIVEDSRKDDFWGAIPTDGTTLIGMNVLGRLLMELREEIKQGKELRRVEPPSIPEFLLFDEAMGAIDFRTDKSLPYALGAEHDNQAVHDISLPLFEEVLTKLPIVQTSGDVFPPIVEKTRGMIEGLKPYSEYKQSEQEWLGKVPAHWDLLPGHAAYGKRKIPNTGLKEKTVLSLSYGRIKVKATDKQHGLVPMSYETYQIVDEGNIIIRGTDLQNDKTSLRIGLARNRGIISSAYLCLETRGKVSPEYGYQMLSVFDLTKAIYRYGSGLRQNLDHGEIKRLPIFLPPRDEQAAIVRFLDHANRKIDSFIRAKRKLIALLNEQKQAVIHRAVTRGLDPNAKLKPSGIPWLGDIPAHWEVWRIGRFAKVGNGSTPARSNMEFWSGGHYPWLNSSHVNRGFIDGADQFVTSTALRECHLPKVAAGSVLIAITGQGKTRGTSAVLGIEATINQHIAYITPRLPVVSASFLQLSFMAAYSTLRAISDDSGSTKGALTCEDLKRFKLAVPSITEQERLVAAIEAETKTANTAIARTEREIALMQEYRTRLTFDIVTGKLDVREAAAKLPDMIPDATPEPIADDEALEEIETEES